MASPVPDQAMIRQKLKAVYQYLGAFGTGVCLLGGAVMIAPLVIVIQNNIAWNEVATYKKKIEKAGYKIGYDFCEGDKEYLIKPANKNLKKEIVICTQKSRRRIGEKDYIISVLAKASGIGPITNK